MAVFGPAEHALDDVAAFAGDFVVTAGTLARRVGRDDGFDRVLPRCAFDPGHALAHGFPIGYTRPCRTGVNRRPCHGGTHSHHRS